MINEHMARIIHDDRMRELRREADESRLAHEVRRSRGSWLSVVLAIVTPRPAAELRGPAEVEPDLSGSPQLAELEHGQRL